jgi:hypothetical protein
MVGARNRWGVRTAGLAMIACVCGWLACASPWTADAAAASGPLKWSAPVLVDHARVPTKPAVLYGLSCPGSGLCIGVGPGGQVQSSLDPGSAQAWHGATIDSGATLQAVSCPSTTLCVAVSSGGDLLSSIDPTAGTWSTAGEVFSQPGAGLGAVACATVSLCVAVAGNSQIATSTDPASGVWSVTTVPGDHQLDSVSCPSSSLCVIADFDGAVLTATNPAAGASAYASTDLSGDVKSPAELFTLLSVSCGSATECVASDDNGDLLATNDPAGGASAWSAAHVDGANLIDSVSCVASGLCVAVDGVGNLFASTAPDGTRQSWTATDNVDPSGFDAVVCQSAALCLAAAGDGTIAVSHDPSAGAATWSHTGHLGSGVTHHPALVAVSCPSSSSSCVALDGAGNLLSTDRLAGGSASWNSRALNPGLGAAHSISCVAGGFCVAMGPQSHVAVGSVRGSAPWKLTNLNLLSIDDNGVESPDSLGSVSCASRTLCVATDYSDGVGSAGLLEISNDPATGSWGQASLGSPDFDFFTAISCPSNRLCVAGDGQGDRFAVSTSAGRHWRFVNAGSGEGIDDVSCPTSSFCAAVDQSGNVLTTTDPSGGRTAWHHVRIEHRALTAIACASRSLCVASGQRDRVLVSVDPGGGASSWKSAALGPGLTGVTCPSARLCLATTDAGTVRLGRLRS